MPGSTFRTVSKWMVSCVLAAMGCSHSTPLPDSVGAGHRVLLPMRLRSSDAPTRSLPGAKVVPEADEVGGEDEAVAEVEAPESSAHVPIAMDVQVPDDLPAIVYMAAPGVRHAIIYLHGHCGSLDKIGSWAPEVTRYGTLIALRGNWACAGAPGRFRWGMSIRYLDKRIRRAAHRVQELRGGDLDVDRLTVIGYSQGAEKAEQLPRRYPERYPRIVLAGPPTAPHPWRLAPAEAVVVVAGENEVRAHILRGFRRLQNAGALAAYMELPDARHGEFGPHGAEVFQTALWWLFDRAP